MKEYLLLYKSSSSKYYPIKNNMPSGLWDLNEYFLSDYKYYELYNKIFFDQEQIHGQETIVINDKKNQNLYILINENDIEKHISNENDIEKHISDDDRINFINELNSCKISYNNFIEFRQKWIQLKLDLPPFAVIYRDDNDWIDVQGFQTQQEMEAFVDII